MNVILTVLIVLLYQSLSYQPINESVNQSNDINMLTCNQFSHVTRN